MTFFFELLKIYSEVNLNNRFIFQLNAYVDLRDRIYLKIKKYTHIISTINIIIIHHKY
jgi:hypothetical protein